MAKNESCPELSSLDSYVRAAPGDPLLRAKFRVAEYLLALGLEDREVRDRFAADTVAQADQADRAPEQLIATIVEAARARVDAWLRGVVGLGLDQVDPTRLRLVLRRYPDRFLDMSAATTALRRELGGGETAGPLRRMRRQQILPLGLPRWAAALVPAVALVAGTCVYLASGLRTGGWSVVGALWLLLFGALLMLHAIATTVALMGLVRRWKRSGGRARTPRSGEDRLGAALGRTAVVVPIYHEDPQRVFAGVAAIREELQRTPGAEAFEIFVLSDSRDPFVAADEERSWRRVAHRDRARIPVYYRRRLENRFQKSGNLAEFCEQWAHRYPYFVVLDADSLMQGATLVELVRRMEAEPELGLLQAPVELARGETPLARALQFAQSAVGPLYASGLAAWAGEHGNYFGHNAVIRMEAFVAACGLPVLSGEPPLGGPILSHDFVEAALLLRDGWRVRMADDLTGSYEESPPTLEAFVQRDRRWCQGNLQHLRIVLARGLAPMSRLHLLLGALAYLASPLWLLFLAASALMSLQGGGAQTAVLVFGLCASAAGLFASKVFCVLDVLRHRRSQAFGGGLPYLASLGLEVLLGACVAPILMIHHTRIVAEVLLGGAVGWTAQRRRAERGRLLEVLRAQRLPLLAGVLLSALALFAGGAARWWWLISAPLLASPLVSLFLGSERAGGALRRLRLFLAPTEVAPVAVLRRTEALLGYTADDDSARFRDLILDPVLHRQVAARVDERIGDAARDQLLRRAVDAGPAGLRAEQRAAILSDAPAILELHRRAWVHWPVEAWALARDVPATPPEAARSNE